MSSVVEVRLWGRTIGAAALESGGTVATFQYESSFVDSGIQLSPLMMPLDGKVYQFPELAYQTFHGLPGLLADSLPDKFGNILIDAWLASNGRSPDSFNSIERLCYTGVRGMGALEFSPPLGPRSKKGSLIEVDKLVALASEVLHNRQGLQFSLDEQRSEEALAQILRVGTSAGGARAKAVIAWNPKTNEVRSGQVPAEKGFDYWLLKFDGVSDNRDKELEDPKGYGLVEYAYSIMARRAGISMNDCRIFEENGRHHFMTRRFDRLAGGEKLHMQSLCALAHYDFNVADGYSYEQAFLVMRQLGLGMSEIEEQFRRMAFNIIARNQDDHVKNIAFLMDKSGSWALAPAYDMTYSYNPEGLWTSQHQMSMNGKRRDFTIDDFKACARKALMKRGRAESIVEEVIEAVRGWRDIADEVKIPSEWRDQIWSTLRLEILP